MLINPKFQNLSGSFDTETGLLVCVAKHKYRSVDLCFKDKMNIPFAEIALSEPSFSAASSVFEDAQILGNEIVTRWNNHAPRSMEQIRDDFECWFADLINKTYKDSELSGKELAEWRDNNTYDCILDNVDNNYLCGCWEGWQASRNQALNKESSLQG